MLQTGTLPIEPTAVPVYRPTGKTTSITPNWFPGENPTLIFVELGATADTFPFNPTQMSSSEVQLAQAKEQGQLLGLLAVPFSAVLAADEHEQSKLFAEIDGRRMALSQMFDHFSGVPNDLVVVGAYSGYPDVTDL